LIPQLLSRAGCAHNTEATSCRARSHRISSSWLLFAVLTKRGFQDAVLTPDFDSKFEAAYVHLLKLGRKAGVTPNFNYRTNKLHGVSSALRDAIDAASRNSVVSLENPSFTRIRTKLSEQSASFHLSRLPIAEDIVTAIVESCLSDLIRKNEQTALKVLQDFVFRFSEELLAGYTTAVASGALRTGAKEVNDAVWGTIALSPLEVLILDSPLLQRLRYIRQIGVSHWVYPCAGHSRFEHTLGVLHQTQQLIEAINHFSVTSTEQGIVISPATHMRDHARFRSWSILPR
jgi:hypothetical protein